MVWLPTYTYLLAVSLLLAPTLAAVCPDSCVCSTTRDGLHRVACSNLVKLYKYTLRQKNLNINILDLSHNNITKISHELDKLTEMVTLDLSTNGLTVLNKFLQSTKKLVHLNLAHNRLQKMSLSSLPASVSSLDLSGNLLKDIPSDLGYLPSLEHLLLEGNPLNCSCSNIIGRNRLLAANVYIDDVKCRSPVELNEISWLELKTEDICKPFSKTDYNDMTIGKYPIDPLYIRAKAAALKPMSLVASKKLEDGQIIHNTNLIDDDDTSQFVRVKRYSALLSNNIDSPNANNPEEGLIEDSVEGSGFSSSLDTDFKDDRYTILEPVHSKVDHISTDSTHTTLEGDIENHTESVTVVTVETNNIKSESERISKSNKLIDSYTETTSKVGEESTGLTNTAPNFDFENTTVNISELTTSVTVESSTELEGLFNFNDQSKSVSENFSESTTSKSNDKIFQLTNTFSSNERTESIETTTFIHESDDKMFGAEELFAAHFNRMTDDALEGSGEGSGFYSFEEHTENILDTTTPIIEELSPDPVHRIFKDEEETNITEFRTPDPPSVYQGGPNWHSKSDHETVTTVSVSPELTKDTTVSEQIRVTQASEVLGQAPSSDENIVPHKTGTYVCIALIIVLLVGLIGFAITKGQMRKRRDRRLLRQQKRDVEKASKEMVDMNKSLLGKPAIVGNAEEKKVNGKYELVPTHESNQKKGENGDVANGIKHENDEVRTDSPRDTNQNKSSSVDNNLTHQNQLQQQETSFDSEPGIADFRKDTNSLSSEDIFVPINDDENPRLSSNIDLDVSQPQINGDPIVDSDFLSPSRVYVPVYSPDMGRVRIKMTETPKPKTPVLVTRSRSNAGDIIITPTLDGNASKSTT